MKFAFENKIVGNIIENCKTINESNLVKIYMLNISCLTCVKP